MGDPGRAFAEGWGDGFPHPHLCSDSSQSDPETKDFWLNMAALTEALQRQAEQNPAASYYNVVLLRYQVGHVERAGPEGAGQAGSQ